MHDQSNNEAKTNDDEELEAMNTIKLETSDGDIVQVPAAVALKSTVIANLLDAKPLQDDSAIPIPKVTKSDLQHLLAWPMRNKDENDIDYEIKTDNYIKNFVEKREDEIDRLSIDKREQYVDAVSSLICAVYYLNVEDIAQSLCRYIAIKHLKHCNAAEIRRLLCIGGLE